MNKYRMIPTAILVVLFVGVVTPQFAHDPAQNPAQKPEKNEQEMGRRALLLGLMRTINTAEVTDRSQYGTYASWETLLAHNSEYLNGWLARYHPETPHFAGLPEILPGYSLRLNVHSDGQGYDVRLQDTAEEKWGYAAFSDERGAIYEGGPLR